MLLSSSTPHYSSDRSSIGAEFPLDNSDEAYKRVFLAILHSQSYSPGKVQCMGATTSLKKYLECLSGSLSP